MQGLDSVPDGWVAQLDSEGVGYTDDAETLLARIGNRPYLFPAEFFDYLGTKVSTTKYVRDLGSETLLQSEIDAMKGVLQNPEWHPEGDVFEHTLRCLEETPDDGQAQP